MECPVCGLINPPNTGRCDCGYDFDKPAGCRQRRSFGLHSVLPSLWFAWFVVTTADFATLNDSGFANLWNYFPNAIFNLFTPMLMGNFSAKGVPFLLLGLFVGDLAGKRIRFKSLRIVYNFLFLFTMTVVVDMIVWGSPMSIQNIREAYNCVSTIPRPTWCAVAPRRP